VTRSPRSYISFDVDLCPTCAATFKSGKDDVNVACCAGCGRKACTCFMERAKFEDDDVKYFFCAEGMEGGCFTP